MAKRKASPRDSKTTVPRSQQTVNAPSKGTLDLSLEPAARERIKQLRDRIAQGVDFIENPRSRASNEQKIKAKVVVEKMREEIVGIIKDQRANIKYNPNPAPKPASKPSSQPASKPTAKPASKSSSKVAPAKSSSGKKANTGVLEQQTTITPENAAVEMKKHLNAVISDSNTSPEDRSRASRALAGLGGTEAAKKTAGVSKRKASVEQTTRALESSQQPPKGSTGAKGDVGRKLTVVDQAIVKNNMKGVIANRNKVGVGRGKKVAEPTPREPTKTNVTSEPVRINPPMRVHITQKQYQKKLDEIFKRMGFGKKAKTYEGMVKEIEVPKYNASLRARVAALSPDEIQTVLRGGRRAQTIVKQVKGGARNDAKTHVDSVLYNKFGDDRPKSLGQTEMAVLGSRKRVDLSERVKSIRVLSNHKGAIGLTPNQRIRKTRIGKEVVDRVVGAKGYRQRHMPMDQYRKQQAEQKRLTSNARIAREAENKRLFGSKTPMTSQQKATEAARSRQFRLEVDAKRREAVNQNAIDVYKELRGKLALKGNTQSAKQILKEMGATPGQARVGKTLIRNSNLNVPQTTGFKRKVRGQILQKGYVKMNHSGKSPTKPQSITDNMHEQVKGKLTGKTHSFQTGVSKTGKPIYKTTPEVASGNLKIARLDQAMSIPGRSFSEPGGAVLFNMGSQIRVDIQRVLANLKTGFPTKVSDAIKASAEVVGKKMLDIIEPYVPKDTYYMYQSAKSNADQSSLGQINVTSGAVADDSYMYGVSFSYNTPYAELVYFGSQRHGKEYNDYHHTVEKGEKETARWVEVAFAKEQLALRGLLDIYAKNVHAALNSVSK